MVYIDFDGVILDTEKLLFKEWRMNPNRLNLPEGEKIKYMQRADWNYIINNSPAINNSIDYLKKMNSENNAILTKIHSMENEGYAKFKWIRENGIILPITFVPFYCKKTDIVNACGNILIDDCLKNLDDWTKMGGEGIFFDMNDDNVDSWQQKNVKGYQKVLSLSKLNNFK